MESKYVIIIDGDIFSNNKTNTFTLTETMDIIHEMSEGEDMINEDYELVSFDDLITFKSANIVNDGMVEFGRSYVTINIVRLF